MSNITIYKKPHLAVLEEKKKIRDYSQEERLAFSYKLVDDLLKDLGVSSKSDTEHHKRAIKYIAEECGRFSFEEVKEAFKMALNGVLEIDLFQQINVLVLSKVLKLFQKHKNDKLRAYRLSKPKNESISEKEKRRLLLIGVKKQLEYFLEFRKIDLSRLYVYDVFDKKGLMLTDLSYKKEVKKDAIEILKNEYKNKKAGSRDEYNSIKNVIKEVNNEKSTLIINKCKELALEEYLRKKIKSEKDISKIIEIL